MEEDLEYQKADLKSAGAEVKTTCDKVCGLNSDELKEIHPKYVQLQNKNIRCINLLAKAKKKLSQEDATPIET